MQNKRQAIISLLLSNCLLTLLVKQKAFHSLILPCPEALDIFEKSSFSEERFRRRHITHIARVRARACVFGSSPANYTHYCSSLAMNYPGGGAEAGTDWNPVS